MASLIPATAAGSSTATGGSPPFLRLPAELVLRIFVFAARLGTPRDVANLRQTSRTFCLYLSDPGRSTDQGIWRCSAISLLDVCVPTSLTLDKTWQEFVKRTWRLAKPSSMAASPVRELQEAEHLCTSHGGPFPPLQPHLVEDADRLYYEYDARILQRTNLVLRPVPKGARRVIDFVHSGTEGIRGELPGTPYIGADSGAFFTFSDDARQWVESPGQLEKGFIVGDTNLVEKKSGVLVTAGMRDLTWLKKKHEFEESVEETAFLGWVRSCVHSDANLSLVPNVVHKANKPEKTMVVITVIRYSAPDVVEKMWDLEDASLFGNAATKEESYGPWSDDTNWEFRSAGDYLIICDDNDGTRESTVTCFKPGKCIEPLWQRKMVGRDTDVDGNDRLFFYDNDGIRMNNAIVVYASRCKRTIGSSNTARRDRSDRSIMEFLLLSTQTGEIVRVLEVAQENRPQEMDNGQALCAWCSFSLSESFLVATVGGRTPGTSINIRYQYSDILIWDLTTPSRSSSPTHAISIPKSWNASGESFTTISTDGRWLGVQVGWELATWDLQERTCIGVWRITDAERYMGEEPWDVSERITGWNGLWVKYRDIFDYPGSEEKSHSTPPSSPASFHTAPESTGENPKVNHEVTFLTNRMLRRIIDRHEDLRELGVAEDSIVHDETVLSIFSDPDDSEEESDSDDDDSDDGDSYMTEDYFEENYNEEYDTDDEALFGAWDGGGLWGLPLDVEGDEWYDTESSDSGSDSSIGDEVKTVYDTDGSAAMEVGTTAAEAIQGGPHWDDEETVPVSMTWGGFGDPTPAEEAVMGVFEAIQTVMGIEPVMAAAADENHHIPQQECSYGPNHYSYNDQLRRITASEYGDESDEYADSYDEEDEDDYDDNE